MLAAQYRVRFGIRFMVPGDVPLWAKEGTPFPARWQGSTKALAPSLSESVRPPVEAYLRDTQRPGTEQVLFREPNLLLRATRSQRPAVTVPV